MGNRHLHFTLHVLEQFKSMKTPYWRKSTVWISAWIMPPSLTFANLFQTLFCDLDFCMFGEIVKETTVLMYRVDLSPRKRHGVDGLDHNPARLPRSRCAWECPDSSAFSSRPWISGCIFLSSRLKPAVFQSHTRTSQPASVSRWPPARRSELLPRRKVGALENFCPLPAVSGG